MRRNGRALLDPPHTRGESTAEACQGRPSVPPSPSPSPSPSPTPSRRALLIGNAAYADKRLARLAVPERDVRAFEAVLRERIIGDTDRSLFTHHLVEGLQTGAAAPDAAEVRIRDLYDYAHREVLAHQSKQTPQLWLDGPQTGDLIIARNPNPPASTPPDPLRPELRAALEDANHLTRVGAVLAVGRLIDRASGEARDGLVAVLEQHRQEERHLDVLETIDTALGAAGASSPPSSRPEPVAKPRAASAPAAATPRAGPGAEPAKSPPEQATAAPGRPIRPPQEESPVRDRRKGTGKGTRSGDGSARRASPLWLLLLPLLAAGLWLARGGFQQTELATDAPRQDAVQQTETAPEPFSVFQDRLKDGSEGPAMIALPGDCFEMGSPEKEPDRDGDERQHEVCVDAFAIGRTEVTVGEFRRFVERTDYQTDAEGRGGCVTNVGGSWDQRKDSNWRDPGFEQANDEPVVCVSWNDANAYADWLSQQTGDAYRLPTEAEWEYAARAGTETPFWTGACIHTDEANYNGNFDYDDCGAKTGLYRERTVPVGILPANPGGLHEVLGNVLEWTCSEYDAADPLDANSQGSRTCCVRKSRAGAVVLRGGSWEYNPGFLRAAYRSGGQPSSRGSFIGFRLARTFSPLPR